MMLGFDANRSIAEVKDILTRTATVLPGCVPAAAPALNAYAAVLGMDRDLSVATAPVRMAILDVVNENGTDPAPDEFSDGKFSESDLARFVQEIVDRDGLYQDFSRFDLNGDGYTGYLYSEKLDLNADGDTDDDVPLNNGLGVTFSEAAVTDAQALCFYAYSPLFAKPAEFDERPMLLWS